MTSEPRGLGTSGRSATIWCAVVLGAEGSSRDSGLHARVMGTSGSRRSPNDFLTAPPAMKRSYRGRQMGLEGLITEPPVVSRTTAEPSAFIT